MGYPFRVDGVDYLTSVATRSALERVPEYPPTSPDAESGSCTAWPAESHFQPGCRSDHAVAPAVTSSAGCP
ncbi:MAG: hypothetical protein ACRDQ5_22780, partial [Sciscionella sp.]